MELNKRTVEIRVGGRYRLGKKLGSGSFGEIYEAEDIFGGSNVAVKLECISNNYNYLLQEARLMKSFQDEGFPKMYWYGVAGDYNCMVMELLGENLENLFDYCMRNFTLKTILLIAFEAIDRLKYFHDHHYVHCDIKPQNFLIGKDDKENKIYLIDYGLSKRYRDEYSKIHISYKDKKSLIGTARFASRNNHNGVEQTRRDDMESLGYIFLYLLKGSLPWQGIKAKDKAEKYEKIKEMKNTITAKELFKGLPEEFVEYMEHVYSLKFEDEPNYKHLTSLFKELYKIKDYENDNIADWITVKTNDKVLKDASICQSDDIEKAEKKINESKSII